MNRILRHISIFTAIVAIAACSMVEMPDNLHENKTVEFVVRNTTFSSIDVSVASTKALTGTELTAVERKIVNAYFLVFGEDGTLEEFRTLEVTDNTIPSQTLTHDYDNGPIKVCYLANVSEDVARSYETWNDILTKPLAITYPEYNEDYFSTTGHVGIPSLDGELCFPMFNFETYPGKTASNGVVEVQLERLFAKVVVNLSTDFETGGGLGGFIGGIFDAPNLTLHSYKVTNLPTNVILNNQEIENSSWVTYDNKQDGKEYFKAPINVDIEDITVSNDLLIETPEELLTLYVPEYYLAPKSTASNNTDQKLKPTMFDESKRPVFITIAGLAHQSNFVDVPLEYNIYLGEDAVKDFDLRRNRQYNNNMTVTGTGEAILGTDTRVEPTYHNLADPTNSGTLNPANCYIISKPGRYLIPMCKGNQPNNTLAGTTAEIQHINHLDNDVNSIPADKISIITIDGKQYIQFDVNMYSGTTFSPTDVVPSNELLCLKDANNNIVWSWHLWMCEDSNRPDVIYHNYPKTGAIVMDRSLGAVHRNGLNSSLLQINLAFWDDCLYYQWGRKDPMATSGNTLSHDTNDIYTRSIQNPRTFYTKWTASGHGWNENLTNGKSIDDPCPPGYKVPSNGIWRTTGNGSTGLENIVSSLGVHGYPYSLEMSSPLQNNILYPFVGYLGLLPDGNSVGLLGTEPTTTLITDQKLDESIVVLYYGGNKQEETGYLWSKGGEFQYLKSEIDITSTEIFINAADRWFPANPNTTPRPKGLVAGGTTSLNDQVKATSTYKGLNRLAKFAVDIALAAVNLDSIVLGLMELLPTSGYVENHVTTITNPERAIQIRCVSESSTQQ